jgi:hypothetical protein
MKSAIDLGLESRSTADSARVTNSLIAPCCYDLCWRVRNAPVAEIRLAYAASSCKSESSDARTVFAKQKYFDREF